jgi:cardiolipin synthase
MGASGTILVDSREFVEALAADVRSAQTSVYVQVLTFEADDAGRELIDILRRSPAADKRLLVDAYVKVMISDRLVFGPRALFDRPLQEEARETRRLLRDLNDDGIRTRYSSPLGFLLRRLPRRNHKKLFIVDDRIAYVGGINVSDHNYRWHDVMLRIEDRAVASFLRDDFLSSWNGQVQSGRFDVGDYTLYLLDGRSNRVLFEDLLALFKTAKKRIWMETPYLTFPVYEHLRAATDRGVTVEILAPAENNKPLFDRYTRWEARRSGIELRCLPGEMTHVKALLLDDHTLILGSSNFDYLSYSVQQELFVVIRDTAVIESIIKKVVRPDRDRSVAVTERESRLAGTLSHAALRLVLVGSAAISGPGWK